MVEGPEASRVVVKLSVLSSGCLGSGKEGIES